MTTFEYVIVDSDDMVLDNRTIEAENIAVALAFAVADAATNWEDARVYEITEVY